MPSMLLSRMASYTRAMDMSATELEQRIERAQLRIEQLRLYIAMLHPSHRSHEATRLRPTILELHELMEQRDLQLDRQRALNTA